MANEKRLIDAKEYCKELYEEMNYPGRSEEFMMAIDVAIADLADAPTVDAVEVCRCKDCSYAKDMHPLANAPAYKMGVCTVRKEDGIGFTVWGQDFCSYGERREGE